MTIDLTSPTRRRHDTAPDYSQHGHRKAFDIDNPYWEAVKDRVEADSFRGNPVVGEYRLDRSVEESIARTPNRQRLVKQYCWTIPDPETVAFVAKYATGGLVDPIAGTGYWAYLLGQLGVDVVCYDLNAGSDTWHGDHAYVPISAKDCAEAVALHPDRTLFLSWPPHGEDVGARILLAYRGTRVIYLGDGRGGATGDDRMHLILETDWAAVDSRQPVQWWGQHDCVTLYERSRPTPPDGAELRAATTG